MFTIGLVTAFSIIIIFAAWMAKKYNKPLIPILIVLLAIGAMWIYLHSWLFALVAILLWVSVTLFLGATKKLAKVLLGLLVLVIFLGGLWFTTPLRTYYNIAFGNIWVVSSERAKEPKVAETDSPKIVETESPEVVETECVEAVVIETQTHGDKVLLDLNDGDPFDYSLTVVNPDFHVGNKTLVVLVEPMYIFDVVYPKMYFTSYRLQGTQEQAICSAMKITGKDAYAYVYVGKEEDPKGWTNPYLALENYWWSKFEEKQYSEAAITIGVDSLPFQLSTTDKNRRLVSVDVLHGQFWNPTVDGVVVHPNVGEGYTLTVPLGWQGTYWTIADGKPELVQARIIQTSKEVVERDELSLSNVTILYCGATVPTTELKIGEDTLNWVTELDGWTCEVTVE